MSEGIIYEEQVLWWIRLMMFAVCATPLSIWGQTASFHQPAHAVIDQHFAGYDDSLTRAADTLLATSAQVATAVTAKENVDKTLAASLAIHGDQQSRFRIGGGSDIAAARLDLLRPAIDPILQSHGVPVGLAAVILVESGARPDALSPKGARGLWQLMPNTARRYGLRVDAIQDDRLDLFRATTAAARYLHDLYSQFGDWKLALAAYNTGEANVESAILRAHTQDFEQLSSMRMLPLQTINYVPRVFASIRSTGQPSSFAEYHGPTTSLTVFASSSR
jgi:hypothetical protein